jgi:hypothetical protein
MARSKKTRGPEELLKSMNESSDEVTRPYIDIKSIEADDSDLDEVDEADDVELTEAEDSDPDKTTEIDLAGKPRRRKAAAKKPRAARKRKEPVVVEEEITAVLEPKQIESAEIEAAPEFDSKKTEKAAERKSEKKEKKPEPVAAAPDIEPVTRVSPSKSYPEADHLREDVSIATAGLHKTMDSMVRQWSSVKEISGSICHELERVNTMLKAPAPQIEPADIKEYLKQAAPRITLANKIALGVSAAAVVFSIISLSLSSSTRHTLLEQSATPRVAQRESYDHRRAEKPASFKAVTEAVTPKVAEAAPPPVVAAPVASEPAKAEPKAIEVAKAPPSPKAPFLLAPPKARSKSVLAAKERRGRSRRSRFH